VTNRGLTKIERETPPVENKKKKSKEGLPWSETKGKKSTNKKIRRQKRETNQGQKSGQNFLPRVFGGAHGGGGRNHLPRLGTSHAKRKEQWCLKKEKMRVTKTEKGKRI